MRPAGGCLRPPLPPHPHFGTRESPCSTPHSQVCEISCCHLRTVALSLCFWSPPRSPPRTGQGASSSALTRSVSGAPRILQATRRRGGPSALWTLRPDARVLLPSRPRGAVSAPGDTRHGARPQAQAAAAARHEPGVPGRPNLPRLQALRGWSKKPGVRGTGKHQSCTAPPAPSTKPRLYPQSGSSR